VTLKVDGDDTDYLKEVSASYPAEVGPASLSVEPSYIVNSKIAKLKVSAGVTLGAGLSANAKATATGMDDVSADVELGYSADVGDGVALSATVSPLDQTGEVKLTGTTANPAATWVATSKVAMGEVPSLSLKRVQKF